MKTFSKNLIRVGIALLLFVAAGTLSAQGTFVTIKGVLKDAKSGDKITYATISVPNTSIGTVSNSEGEFTLKVSASLQAGFFEVSHLGYATKRFSISESTGEGKTFYLDLQPIQLKEISVIPKDPREMVAAALRNIKKNYSQVPNMMTGFYRESIKQRRDYVSISEAVVDIYKTPYLSMSYDQVKVFKGRKSTNVKKADTLMVQLQGGPDVALLLDVVKNTDLSIALDDLDNYQFELGSMVSMDNKLNWVVKFSPNVVKDEPLYYGTLYISQEDMAITRAEFSLDLNDEAKAAHMFIQKKPMGLLFMPTLTNYLITYKEENGKYYLNYVRVDLKFRCDWKKRLFRNNYTVVSELAITDRHEDNIVKFTNQEQFKSTMVLSEKIGDFEDHDFWGEYNIIEPEISIQNAILKLSKSMKK
ncbi:MAG TPA: carboxypeptidase-like regulatory domain-containing protein [Bacteroidales bacterium]|nr:carboxypeptidase-like regulatory domain-containing protein [Bacteroidales bacterium]